jgi:hypothetical protein
MFIPVEIRPSLIFGKGIFPLQDVKKGSVICSFTTDSRIITETEYLTAIQQNHYSVVRTGTRYVGKYFTFTDKPEADLNFFNHSFSPNALVHCGVVIARQDISKGQELTIDYRYLIDDTESGVYNDAISGRPIRGFPARAALLETSRQLIALLDTLDDSWQG